MNEHQKSQLGNVPLSACLEIQRFCWATRSLLPASI